MGCPSGISGQGPVNITFVNTWHIYFIIHNRLLKYWAVSYHSVHLSFPIVFPIVFVSALPEPWKDPSNSHITT